MGAEFDQSHLRTPKALFPQYIAITVEKTTETTNRSC